MKKTVKQRLMDFILYKGISIREFERLTGASNGYFKNITDNIGTKRLSGIFSAFPELNRDWLLYGIGDMLVEAGNIYTQNNSGDAHDNVQNNASDKYLELLKMQGEQLCKTQEQLTTAQKQLTTSQEQVNRLLSMLDMNNKKS